MDSARKQLDQWFNCGRKVEIDLCFMVLLIDNSTLSNSDRQTLTNLCRIQLMEQDNEQDGNGSDATGQ